MKYDNNIKYYVNTRLFQTSFSLERLLDYLQRSSLYEIGYIHFFCFCPKQSAKTGYLKTIKFSWMKAFSSL